MRTKKEMRYKRLIEIISKRVGKIISLEGLFKKVNFILPNDMVIKSTNSLSKLVRSQSEFKVFRCRFNEKIYYIFRKEIQGGE